MVGFLILRRLIAERRRIELQRLDESEEISSAWARSVNGIRVLGLLAFALFEAFWRVMFEFVLAYFQMRD